MLQRLKNSIEKRKGLTLPPQLHRLCDGAGDGLPGVYLDIFGAVLLLHLLDGECCAADCAKKFSEIAPEICNLTNTKSLYLRVHNADARATAKQDAQLVFGETVGEFIVSENDAQLIVNPVEQTNAGLFLDMREVRTFLRQSSANLKILNTFCFTGSLGVASGLGQAREVVQVDISGAALGWAKRNWELNLGGTQSRLRLIKEDSADFIEKERRRIERGAEHYDIVIIDPPSYGSSKGKRFSVEKDLPGIVMSAFQLLNNHARMIVTTNNTKISAPELTKLVTSSIGDAVSSYRQLIAPPDFTSATEKSHSMRGVLVEIKR